MKNNYISIYFLLLSQLWILTITTLDSKAQKFVIPVMPDTQNEVVDRQEMFLSRFRWIIEMKDSLNIPFVLHVGDVVNYDNLFHWKNAGAGFEMLDNAGIPYAIAVGNHDTEAVAVNDKKYCSRKHQQESKENSKVQYHFPS